MAHVQEKRMHRMQWHQRVTIRRRIVVHVVRFVVVRFKTKLGDELCTYLGNGD